MVRSMCLNIAREWQRQNALTVSLCHYVPRWCDFLFQQPLHIATISWMILSNAWHGLQRLARKRSFHRLVRHSCCCLSFNGHKRKITRHTWSHWKSTANPSCILWWHWFVLESQVGWQMPQWAKREKTKKCGEVYWTFPWSAVCVQLLPENDKDKRHWLRHYVTMSLCDVTSCFSSHCT